MKEILNDQYILDIYEKISMDTKEGNIAYHDITHIRSVICRVNTILSQLNMPQDMIESANIAAFLHDIGIVDGKEGHAKRSYEIASAYLNTKDIPNKEFILDAIKNHSGNDKDDGTNIIRTALIFADKLDVHKGRITEAGRAVEGNRQFYYIEDVQIMIDKEKVVVNFVCSDDMNVEELETYYFLPKIKKAIRTFADTICLQCEVLKNGQSWRFFER